MKENTLEKQVAYKLSDVITIFRNMILENGIDNFLDDMDLCVYTIDFVEEALNDTICYLDDYPEVDDNDQEKYTDFITENKLVMFYSGEQFEDVINNTLYQKSDATIEEFIFALNYYRDNDNFADFMR
ncbi:MAG: hypothetical protein ACI4DK_06305 [Lachnospiraceae bacterium]